jgi:hypothetical protein
MEQEYVHFAGFLGENKTRSVTVSIRRGTSVTEALFLLTKIMETISQSELEGGNVQPFNEVRIGGFAGPPPEDSLRHTEAGRR